MKYSVDSLLFFPIFSLCVAYAKGMAEYAKFNNVSGNTENCWSSVVNESYEFIEAVKELKPWEAFLEFYDVIHSLIKYFVITYVSPDVFSNPWFWVAIFPFVLPCSIKLGYRYRQNGCIRNHNNANNCKHKCNYIFNNQSLKIYYSTAVQNASGSRHEIREHINIMKKYGIVLTEHLGSENEKDLDMGGKTTAEIYAEDNKLIQECTIFVADITNVSLGVGFMISQAVKYNKPILCVKRKNPDEQCKVSAMIDGCPEATTMYYHNTSTFSECFNKFLCNNCERFNKIKFNPINVLLTGPPGCGKSTIAENLEKEFGMVNISTGQLLRDFVKNNTCELSIRIKTLMDAGDIIPAHLMYQTVEEKLNDPKCKVNGFTLDGYPPSLLDLDNLFKLDVSPNMIFVFECGRNVAINRQCSRNERSTDNFDKASKRVTNYHETNPNFTESGHRWFPHTPVIRVDANKTQNEVWDFVKQSILNNTTKQNKSYFSVLPFNESAVNTTRFHAHIDGKNHNEICRITNDVHSRYQASQGQIKIYPIRNLHLGPQVKENVYSQMMNFHEIEKESDEAFVTAKLGDSYDELFMNAILETAKQTKGKFMVELEQYIGEWTLSQENKYIVDANHIEQPVVVGYDENKISDIPPYELHLGFNLPKESDDLPISLEMLTETCKKYGMSNGGWFIFRNENSWVYRSNEFSWNTNSNENKSLLFEQAANLKIILASHGYTCDVLLSLERVHGIWEFNN
jgi:adenylate kinase family enzyme